MTEAGVVPDWLQYGAFGLCCAMVFGFGWLMRWLAGKFLQQLLDQLKELVVEIKGMRGDIVSLRDELRDDSKRIRYRLDSLRDDIGDLRDESHSWHARLETAIWAGRKITSSSGRMEAVTHPDAPRPRQRSRPDMVEDSDRPRDPRQDP